MTKAKTKYVITILENHFDANWIWLFSYSSDETHRNNFPKSVLRVVAEAPGESENDKLKRMANQMDVIMQAPIDHGFIKPTSNWGSKLVKI